MGRCIYRYNPSELYQRTKPGTAPETTCGARTYPAIDEPDLYIVTKGNGQVKVTDTGRKVARAADDPYCPGHGGCAEPPPPPADEDDVADAFKDLANVVARYDGELPAPLAALFHPQPALTASLPVPQADTSALTATVPVPGDA